MVKLDLPPRVWKLPPEPHGPVRDFNGVVWEKDDEGLYNTQDDYYNIRFPSPPHNLLWEELLEYGPLHTDKVADKTDNTTSDILDIEPTPYTFTAPPQPDITQVIDDQGALWEFIEQTQTWYNKDNFYLNVTHVSPDDIRWTILLGYGPLIEASQATKTE